MKQVSVPKKASHEDWHPEDIKAALRKIGWTLRSLAAAHGLKGGCSGLSFALTHSFPAGERRIAEALGLHPKDIWPSRYFEDGTRKPQGFRAIQSTRATSGRNGNERVAA